ncbi:MAG: hypothetical protein M1826_007453 [Phylliscum demangeonii]|nr:MAG: hypothetical protein M1826_007453 [Phylliscum demangeonii]
MEGVSQLQQLHLVYAIFGLAVLTLAIRLFTRAFVTRQVGLDDFLIIFATVLSLALVILTKHIYDQVAIIHQVAADKKSVGSFLAQYEILQHVQHLVKLSYITAPIYLVQVAATKCSILAFYHRFLTQKSIRMILYGLAAVIVLFAVIMIFIEIFQCHPVEATWQLLRPHKCTFPNPFILQVANSIVNLITDIFVLVLPIPIVLGLHASTNRKIGLVIVFLLGVFGTIATILRLQKAVKYSKRSAFANVIDILDPFFGMIFWSHIEIQLTVICANLPAAAAFWRFMRQYRDTIFSTGKSSAHGTGKSHTGPGSFPRRRGAHAGSSFAMDSRRSQHGLVTSTIDHHSTSSEEQMVPKGSDIVRSTRVVVDVEQAR